MARQLQLRKGTTAQHSTFTGALAEVTVDITKKTVVVHDGVTVGGFPLARSSELDSHTTNTSNPHNVTKTQVGLSNVDNTADADKNVLSAAKLATARTISLTGDVSGSVSFDGSSNVSIATTITDNIHNQSDLSGTVTFSGSTGNTYHNSNIMINGNGAANTIKPSIGFHQPGLYAGTLAMLDGSTFQFREQNGVTSAILANSITGNSATATTLSTNRGNYKTITDSAVVGELMWKNYGNNHTIFDASASISPTGVAKNNTNPDIAWSPTFPTLMGYNGTNTYGVRVDSSRYADSATTAAKANTINNSGSALTFNWSGQGGQPTWLYGGNDPSNAYVYNPSNFSVNYATSATYATTAPVGTNTTQIATTAFVFSNSEPSLHTTGSKLEAQSIAQRTHYTTTYEKVKEISVGKGGVITVSFRLATAAPGSLTYAAVGRIYVNGVAIGTERTTTSSSFVTYTEDITINAGDLVQLYIKLNLANNAESPAKTDSFKIFVAKPTTSNILI